jgi:hypothetical protein
MLLSHIVDGIFEEKCHLLQVILEDRLLANLLDLHNKYKAFQARDIALRENVWSLCLLREHPSSSHMTVGRL